MSSELAKRLKDRIEQEGLAYRRPIVEKYLPLLDYVRKVNDRWDSLEIDEIIDSHSRPDYDRITRINLNLSEGTSADIPYIFGDNPTVETVASTTSSLFTFFEGLSKNNIKPEKFISATRISGVSYTTSHDSEIYGYRESTSTVFSVTLTANLIQVSRHRLGRDETITIDVKDISTRNQLENAITQNFLELEKKQSLTSETTQSLQQVFEILKIDQVEPSYTRPVESHTVLKNDTMPEPSLVEKIDARLASWINNEPSLIKIVNERPNSPTNEIWLIVITESGRIAVLSKKGLVTDHVENILPELGKQNKRLSEHIENARRNPFVVKNRNYKPNFGY